MGSPLPHLHRGPGPPLQQACADGASAKAELVRLKAKDKARLDEAQVHGRRAAWETVLCGVVCRVGYPFRCDFQT